ncbi:hypothetical protein XA68_10429 [Ophiocordyceps unilateralis]|uniref:MYND-type domain-containing protein n=1 Tax=Ophiocordyceps unilateralis TaxID=268505 RepID=A0A2A9PRB9_OPHUN|nr:hypothetical protein XA68_10429 [Ophiocordyceps unilateralis]
MLTPAVANHTSFLYALGNTPATSLTRGVPHGQKVDILSLGCGDVRNVLYTAYAETELPPRKLDITACDYDAKIIGRNVIILTLILDSNEEIDAELWDIYYHLRIEHDIADRLLRHVNKLMSLIESLEIWNASLYGHFITFSDIESFDQVRCVLRRILKATRRRSVRSVQQEVAQNFKASVEIRQQVLGPDGVSVTALRSAAPLCLEAKDMLDMSSNTYWKLGTVITSPTLGMRGNPMFAGLMSDKEILHYGTDPLSGYHLAVGFAPLTSRSPLKPRKGDRKHRAPEAARKQFAQWIIAFRAMAASRRIVLRFVVAEALAFCHTLQHLGASGELSANWYARQFGLSRLVLDEDVYGAGGKGPKTFDVIDTSNLADHLGALNLIIATAPLLKPEPWAAVHTELMIKQHESQQLSFDSLLCGPGITVSLLLGITPVEYWTNAKGECHIAEVFLGLLASSSQGVGKQLLSRLAWKRDDQFSGQYSGRGKLHLETQDACRLLLNLYHRMFESENVRTTFAAQMKRSLTYPYYHRGSFASLLKMAMGRIKTDWPAVCSRLIETVQGDRTLSLSTNYLQELCVQMHLQGVATQPWLTEGIDSPPPETGPLEGWKDVPPVVVLTLVVPRERLDRLYRRSSTHKFASPTIIASIKKDAKWHNMYGDIHMVFGHVQANWDGKGSDPVITEDTSGWQGSSPLVVSFAVPAAVLRDEPATALVSLDVAPSAQSTALYVGILGRSMSIFETTLGDEESVYASRVMPGLVGHRVVCGGVGPFPDAVGDPAKDEKTTILAEIPESDMRISTLTCRVDLPKKGLARLQEKDQSKLRQRDPFVIDLTFPGDKLVVPARFPIPVTVTGCKTRIARTSGYVEVVAPMADALAPDVLADFVYPSRLSKGGVPVALNASNINLDSLPMLKLDEVRLLGWLNTLTGFQFSARERRLREENAAKGGKMKDARTNFKDSLLSIFTHAAGLQGKKSMIFAIDHPERGGVQMLILMTALRLDGDAASVVLDAALLPLTEKLVASPPMKSFLLEIKKTQCCRIIVDDAELVLWKRALPSMVERCRTWNHGPNCEYKRSEVPLSVKPAEDFLCSCGKGKFRAKFNYLQKWERVKQHALRVAISPTFAVPLVEDVVDETHTKMVMTAIAEADCWTAVETPLRPRQANHGKDTIADRSTAVETPPRPLQANHGKDAMDTPSVLSTGGRSAKAQTQDLLQYMAPDIALHEEEKKRRAKAGVPWGEAASWELRDMEASEFNPLFVAAGQCLLCGKKARDGKKKIINLRTCLKCRRVKYCSLECQSRDWRRHQPECQRK